MNDMNDTPDACTHEWVDVHMLKRLTAMHPPWFDNVDDAEVRVYVCGDVVIACNIWISKKVGWGEWVGRTSCSHDNHFNHNL